MANTTASIHFVHDCSISSKVDGVKTVTFSSNQRYPNSILSTKVNWFLLAMAGDFKVSLV